MKNIKSKVLLVSPYLDILGGGEQHIFSILKVFDEKGFACDIVWKDPEILNKLQKTHNISFTHARTIPSVKDTGDYEYCLYVTDGSYFYAKSKHTYIFFMYPKKELLPQSLVSKLKTRGVHFFANGEFTAEKLRKMTHSSIDVIHPYIEDAFFASSKNKKKIILSVGRFFPHLHSKRQDILIEAFLKLQRSDQKYKDYSLVLAGGLKDTAEDQSFYKKLLEMKSDNTHIDVRTNISQKELLDLYHSAKFYWHAAGYGIDENQNPIAVEHLGITPLQGMAAGAVTICHNSGGPRRYIKNNQNGFLYNTIDELVEITSNLTDELSEKIGFQGSTYIQDNFSQRVFEKKVKEYFNI